MAPDTPGGAADPINWAGGRATTKLTAHDNKLPFESLWGLLQDTQKVKRLFKDKAGDELLMLAEQAEDPVAKCLWRI